MKTIIIDGDNLLTIGFHGMKNYHQNGKHIGGIFYFLNFLSKFIKVHKPNKVIVFWDGVNSTYFRQEIYPQYKIKRKNKLTDEREEEYQYQRTRVQMYLEELYIRQGEYEYVETDDCIAKYCVISNDEDKIVVSSDADITQLVDEKTKVFNPIKMSIYSQDDFYLYRNYNFPIRNVALVKILIGDPSDSIHGIKGLGIKKLIKFCPQILVMPITLSELLEGLDKNVLVNNKKNIIFENIKNGVNKTNIDNFFNLNNKLINLREYQFLTQHSQKEIALLKDGIIDNEGRSYKNTLSFMIDDGIFKLLPKTNDGWLNFVLPFLDITRQEKNKKINYAKQGIKSV